MIYLRYTVMVICRFQLIFNGRKVRKKGDKGPDPSNIKACV